MAECIDCGRRLKVEMISQDGKWITAHCPFCGADMPMRPNRPRTDPEAEHMRARRAMMDRLMWCLFWCAIAVASMILITEVANRP